MSSNSPEGFPCTVGKREFCSACAQFATGVAVATVLDPSGDPHGITVNSFTSVSLDPPLILICIGHSAGILAHFRTSPSFGINLLSEAQEPLSVRFAERGRDRFGNIVWVPGETGVPLIPDVLATIECRRVRIETAGDHEIILGEVVRTNVRGGRPLLYFGSAYRRLEP
jgi:flavin reductase (DIM6/NTAB) family NADH-FMN oxidoreductase RutF